MEIIVLFAFGFIVLALWFLIQYWWVILALVVLSITILLIVRKIDRMVKEDANNNYGGTRTISSNLSYTIIKEIDLYEEHLEPAWEYPNPDDQWLFAETIKEYVGTEYDILYVYDDDTYKETKGLKQVPASALQIARNDLSYDSTKLSLKRRWF